MKVSTSVRNACANAIATLIDAGGAAGKVKVFTGAPPPNVSDADPATRLATLTFSYPSFGSASAGVITANAITSDTNVANTGTAGCFRCYDSNLNAVLQGTVTATGGGGDMTFNSTSFVAGGTAAITSMTVTVPVGT